MKKDTVCGMDVGDDTKFTTLHGGRKMYFCSHDCQTKFIKSPDEFMKAGTADTARGTAEKKGGKAA
jgi:YHS domain-containing protein